MSVTINAQNVTFSYPATDVLQDVTFDIRSGDFIGIIGPNGSGKSTLLKNITGYLTPNSGVISIDNKNLTDYSYLELSKKQAVVSQENSVNFNFSVYDLVAMGRAPYMGRFTRMTDKERNTIKEMMQKTNCWHLKDRQLFQISGGEKQRVILARALCQTPDLLLLDEPTTFLDMGYQKELMDLLVDLNTEKNLTVVMVLHDLNLASEYCRKLMLVNRGEIFDVGAPEKVLTEKKLEKVYQTKVSVVKNPITDSPLMVLRSKQDEELKFHDNNSQLTREYSSRHNSTLLEGLKAHIIGGGGQASQLLKDLYSYGCQMSLGVINLGDSDHQTANDLDVFSVVCDPFSPIDDVSYQRAKELVYHTDVVIVAPVPFGTGNVKNLELAKYALSLNKQVVLYETDQERVSDYTSNEAVTLLSEIIEAGGSIIDSHEELLSYLSNQD